MSRLRKIKLSSRFARGAHSVSRGRSAPAAAAEREEPGRTGGKAAGAAGAGAQRRERGRAQEAKAASHSGGSGHAPQHSASRATAPRVLEALCAFVFVAAALCLFAVPSLGLLWHTTTDEDMNTELSAFPSATGATGEPNIAFFGQLGTWFEEHFAFRSDLVQADASVRSQVFGVSNTDQVVVGSDGWLYYGGTLNDYLARNVLTQRGADNIAYNLALVQEHLAAQGKSFLFTIAPNKNSLYPEHMPYYYASVSAQANGLQRSVDLLRPALDAHGVNYVDLFAPFAAQEQVQYLQRDTHWNNAGARVAYNSILAALGKPHEVYAGSGEATPGAVGDLDALLNPAGAQAEANVEFGQSGAYSLAEDSPGHDVTDDVVMTHAKDGEGSLFMFRDSFGNALLPFMASAYEDATFSKFVPYDISAVDASGADTVVVERAERHIADIGVSPPSFLAPAVQDSPEPARKVQTSTTVSCSRDGDYLRVEGILDGVAADDGAEVLVSVHSVDTPETSTFYPFHTTRTDADGATLTDCGYLLYCDAEMVGGPIEPGARVYVTVMTRSDGDLVSVLSQSAVIE